MIGQTYNQLVQEWADHIPLQTLTVGGVLQFNDVSGRYQNEIQSAAQQHIFNFSFTANPGTGSSTIAEYTLGYDDFRRS